MIMNKDERTSSLKKKGAAVGIVICFVAVIALAGIYTFSNYKADLDAQLAKADEQEEMLTEDESEETTTDDILLPESEEGLSGETAGDEDTSDGQQDMTAQSTEEETQENAYAGGEGAEDGSAASAEDTSGVWFSEESTLTWPASGAVIMGYSMDETVFFQTLEQYSYNPAMIIAGEAGETIGASAAGIVTNIEETAQTGMTVTLDMGNGYSAVYGQLADVPVAVGDYVGAGESLGTLSEPTKYYSVEGTNLYFQVLKDGEPVDPMNFME